MVAVIAVGHQRLAIFIFGQQAVSGAEVPATRPLAEIASQSCLVANLRAGSITYSVRQHRMTLLKFRGLRKLGQSLQCANADAAIRIEIDGMKILNALDVHKPPGRDDIVFHQRKQVGATGENLHLSPTGSKESRHLFFGLGAGVLKRLHGSLLD